MKTIRLLLTTLFLAGCVSTKEDGVPIDKTRVYVIVREAVFIGAVTDLRIHPEHRPQMDRARAGLYTLVSQQKWDLSAAGQALASAGIEQTSTPDAVLILGHITSLWDAISNKPVNLSSNRTVEAYVRGADAGLRAALEQPFVAARGIASASDSTTATEFRKASVASRPKK